MLAVGEVVNGAAQFTAIGGLGAEWQFEGNADFLGDGQSQFLIHNVGNVTPGALDLGEVVNGGINFTPIGGLGPEWEYAGNGDFLGDGHEGFLIRNTDGAVDVGEVVNGAAQFTPVGGLGSEWVFKGVGDFLGDGHTGFLVRNNGNVINGALAVGEVVNGALSFTDIGGLGPEWEFVGSGPYVDAGKDDFFLRNTGNGALVVGSAFTGGSNFTQVGGLGPEWNFHSSNAALLP